MSQPTPPVLIPTSAPEPDSREAVARLQAWLDAFVRRHPERQIAHVMAPGVTLCVADLRTVLQGAALSAVQAVTEFEE